MPICVPHPSELVDRVKNIDIIRAKVGAVAFTRSGSILSFATNKALVTHPLDPDNIPPSLHAEENLIRKLRRTKAKQRYGEVYLLVFRVTANKCVSMAKPCVRCSALIDNYGFAGVFYTNWNGEVEKRFE